MLDSISNRFAGPDADDSLPAAGDAASESAAAVDAGPAAIALDPDAILGWDAASDLGWLGTGFGAATAQAEASAMPALSGGLAAIRATVLGAEAATAPAGATADAGADDDAGFVPMACSCPFCGEESSGAAVSPFIGRAGGFTLGDGSVIDPFAANGGAGPGMAQMVADIDPGALIQFSGDKNVDATIFGSKWSVTDLTFSFPTDGAFYGGAAYKDGEAAPGAFQAFNAAQQAMTRYALDLVEQYTGLTFTEVTESATTHATLRFAQTSDGDVPSAYANFPGVTNFAGDVWFGTTGQPFYTTPDIGNWGLATIMHEIGHALGLKHGHQDYEALDLTNLGGINYFEGLLADGSGRDGTRALDAGVNGQSWSIMTYDLAPGFFGFGGEGFHQPQTYQMFDVAALQFLYGANYNANAGNTTYTFSTTTGEMFVDGVGQGAPTSNRVLRTVWDGNGTDSLDLTNYSTGLTIDLTPGSFSNFGAQLADHNARNGGGAPAQGNIALSRLVNGDLRSIIENAYGGSGADTLTGNQVANVLRGNSGIDTLYGGDGGDTLNGGLFKDAAYGGNGDDTFQSTGTDIADDVYGGAGTDTLDVSGYNVFGFQIDLTAGTYDYPPGFGGPFVLQSVENVIGSNQADTITGASGVNTLAGGGGNDILHPGSAGISAGDRFVGGGGSDELLFDTFNNDYAVNLGAGTFDTISGGFASTVAGIENVTSGNGDDRLTGNYAVNVLIGNNGIDVLNGAGGNDILQGGADNDNLIGGVGADHMNGGTGIDRADYGSSALGVTVRLLLGTGTGGDAQGDILVAIEDIGGSNANDTLLGSNLVDNRIWGRDGNDYINGVSGNDSLYGGNGNDGIRGDDGADLIVGGAGIDRADYGSSGAGVTIRLFSGVCTGGDAQGDFVVGIEDVVGSNFGDALIGADGVGNRLWGRNGNDFLRGLSGNDLLNGEIGADRLDGGSGNDAMIGGTWGDVFVFGAGYGQDDVLDFQNGSDLVDLIGGLGFGDLNLSAIAGGVRAAIAAAPATWIDLMGVGLGDVTAADFI